MARLAPMRWWHLDAVVEMEADLFGAEAWSATTFWSELASDRCYLIIDDGEDIPAGYAGIGRDGDDGWIFTCAVRRERQGAGMGRWLIGELLGRPELAGPRVGLEVADDNVAARALYESAGFTEVGRRRRYYEHTGADAVVMMRG